MSDQDSSFLTEPGTDLPDDGISQTNAKELAEPSQASTSKDTVPFGKSASLAVQQIPISLTVAMLVVLVFAAYTGMRQQAFGSGGGFLVTQMSLNFSLLILLSCLYGLICICFGGGGDMLNSTNPLVRYQYILLPIFLISALWLKCYLTYKTGLTNYCNSKNAQSGMNAASTFRWQVLLWNTSKVPIAIFSAYMFVLLVPWALMPFYQLFASDNIMIFFFGIGFWTGCASWASEASCFFEIVRSGCAPAEQIDFKSINASIKDDDDDDDDDEDDKTNNRK